MSWTLWFSCFYNWCSCLVLCSSAIWNSGYMWSRRNLSLIPLKFKHLRILYSYRRNVLDFFTFLLYMSTCNSSLNFTFNGPSFYGACVINAFVVFKSSWSSSPGLLARISSPSIALLLFLLLFLSFFYFLFFTSFWMLFWRCLISPSILIFSFIT